MYASMIPISSYRARDRYIHLHEAIADLTDEKRHMTAEKQPFKISRLHWYHYA